MDYQGVDVLDGLERGRGTTKYGISIVDRRRKEINYMLSHDGMSLTEREGDNDTFFMSDLRRGRLNSLRDKWVLYWKGNRVGAHESDRDLLFETASRYYGESNIAAYKVPKPRKKVDVSKIRRGI